MHVVITGATGNVGTSVCESLGADPDVSSVLGLARRMPTWQAPKTTWEQADVAQDDLVPHLRDADALIHLAWLFQPTHDPVVTWRSNVEGSIRVFDAAVEAGVRTIVYASSVGAYSPRPKDRAVDETWPTHGWPPPDTPGSSMSAIRSRARSSQRPGIELVEPVTCQSSPWLLALTRRSASDRP